MMEKEEKPASENNPQETLVTLPDVLNVKDLMKQSAPGKVTKKRYGLGFIRLKDVNGRLYYSWVQTDPAGKQRVVKYIGATLPRGVHRGPVTPEMKQILTGGR